MAICLERGADLHIAQLMPLPLAISCFGKIQIGFTFLVVPNKGPLHGCVCVCVCSTDVFARLTLQPYLNLFVSQEQLRTKLYFEQGLKKGDEHPAYTHNGVGLWLTFYRL